MQLCTSSSQQLKVHKEREGPFKDQELRASTCQWANDSPPKVPRHIVVPVQLANDSKVTK